ncbi:MAG: hypothetical protein ACYS8W_20375, partial [Planctomycetota bacterium]
MPRTIIFRIAITCTLALVLNAALLQGGERQRPKIPMPGEGERRGDAPVPREIPSSRELLKNFDRDGDGTISREEYGGPPQLFQRLDSNNDGFLTADELKVLDRARRGRESDQRRNVVQRRRLMVPKCKPTETTYVLEGLNCSEVTVTLLVPKQNRGIKIKSFDKGFERSVTPVTDGKVSITLGADPVIVEEGDVPLETRKEPRAHGVGPFAFFIGLSLSPDAARRTDIKQAENEIRKWRIPHVKYLGATCERIHANSFVSFAWDRIDPDFDGKELDFRMVDRLVSIAQENEIQIMPCISPNSNFRRDEKYVPEDSDAYKA